MCSKKKRKRKQLNKHVHKKSWINYHCSRVYIFTALTVIEANIYGYKTNIKKLQNINLLFTNKGSISESGKVYQVGAKI